MGDEKDSGEQFSPSACYKMQLNALHHVLSTVSLFIDMVCTSVCVAASQSPQPKEAPMGTNWLQGSELLIFCMHKLPFLCIRMVEKQFIKLMVCPSSRSS